MFEGNKRGHVDDSFDEFGLLNVRHGLVTALELRAGQPVAVAQGWTRRLAGASGAMGLEIGVMVRLLPSRTGPKLRMESFPSLYQTGDPVHRRSCTGERRGVRASRPVILFATGVILLPRLRNNSLVKQESLAHNADRARARFSRSNEGPTDKPQATSRLKERSRADGHCLKRRRPGLTLWGLLSGLL